MPTEPITCRANITAILDDRVLRCTLPNGKEILGHLAKNLEGKMPASPENHSVKLEMTPYDFEKGRVVAFFTR